MPNVGDLVLGRYRIDRLLGEGGMGAVYLGTHASLGFLVAIKTILPEYLTLLGRRFEREASLIAKIQSPHVVGVHDYGSEDGVPYLVMEYLTGEALDGILDAHGPLSWTEATHWMFHALEGLEAVHAHGIIHRDIKPSNLMITRGSVPTLKLLDFGIARDDAHEKLTGTGMVLGTPDYMPPEQLMGRSLDPRADLYALGMTFYELVSGATPLSGDATVAARRMIEAIPAPRAPLGLPPIPEPIQRIILELLSADADHRPHNANAARGALELAVFSVGEDPDSLSNTAKQALRDRSSTFPVSVRSGGFSTGSPARSGVPGAPSPRPPPASTHSLRVDPRSEPDPDESARPSGLPRPAVPGSSTPQDRAKSPRESLPTKTTHARITIEPEQEPASTLVIVAKIPASRLARQEDRKHLGAAVGVYGRSFQIGPNLWLAVTGEVQSKARIEQAILARYGATASVASIVTTESIQLTAAQLAGRVPLHDVIQDLVNEL